MRITTMLPLLALVALGCSTTTALPERAPDVSGIVTAVRAIDAEAPNAGEQIGTIRVEENPADSSGSAKFDLRLTRETLIVVRPGEVTDPGTFDQILTGQRVDVWITGPVAESYPAQAAASHVLVRDSVRAPLPEGVD